MEILITSLVDIERTANGRLYQLAKFLAPRHEITIISINDWWKAKKKSVGEGNRELEELLDRITIKHLSKKETSPILQELSSYRTIPKILDETDRDFDVHFNYNSLIAGYFSSRKMKSKAVETVYDIADDLPEMIQTSPQIPKPLRPIGGFFGRMSMEKNIKNSRIVTVAGKYLQEDIEGNHVRIIPNGVDTRSFRFIPDEDFRRELGLDSSFVIGYIGALREWVDLEPIYQALKLLKNRYRIKLLVVGGEEGFEQNRQLAKKHGVSDMVVFSGAVPYPKVPEYVSIMDACLIPFRKNRVADNSCPLKLFEYMACERPVISTRINEVRSIVGDMIRYASTAEEYASEMVRLYENDAERKKLGVKGREFVVKNYEWDNINRKFESLLMEASGVNG